MKIRELFSVVGGVEDSLQNARTKPDGRKSMLCRRKYLLSIMFLMQPFKIPVNLLTNGE